MYKAETYKTVGPYNMLDSASCIRLEVPHTNMHDIIIIVYKNNYYIATVQLIVQLTEETVLTFQDIVIISIFQASVYTPFYYL